METKKLFCGIDVSLNTLDVCYQNNLGQFYHLQVVNNIKGFEKILEHTGILSNGNMKAQDNSYFY